MRRLQSFLLLAACTAQPSADDTALVRAHVLANARDTFREPSGALKYKYLVPAGPYNECWEWDSFFMSRALKNYGVLPYAIGTFQNFLALTNVSTGELPGCVTPGGPTQTLYHAKPLIIQGALLAARAAGNLSIYKEFQPQCVCVGRHARGARPRPRTPL